MAKIPFDINVMLDHPEWRVEDENGVEITLISDLIRHRNGYGSDLFIITPEPELNEFELKVREILYSDKQEYSASDPESWKRASSELLDLARKEFVKQGYVIEKKAFHDAVEKISPEVMKEVSETIDLSDFFTEIGKKYPEVPFGRVIQIGLAAYNKSKEEALKDLPRWKKVGVDTGQTNLIKGYKREEDELYRNGKCISLVSLEKLPGFKEI